jgi:hypothetical protein
MIALISEHDTWVSIDPIVGCPADCTYCFVRSHGRTAVRPEVRVGPEEMAGELVRYLSEDPPGREGAPAAPRIVCIGNHTDMLMTVENRAYAIAYARAHRERLPGVPLVFVTKAKVDRETVRRLDEVGHMILVFVSQSFFADVALGPGRYEKRVATPEESCEVIRLIAESDHLRPLHFWRPLTRFNLPDEAAAVRMVRMIRNAGALASVAVGLKYGDFLHGEFALADSPFRAVLDDAYDERSPLFEIFPPDVRDLVLRVGHAECHPVYLNTSCAVSLALEIPEFLGTWRSPVRAVRCDPAHCPRDQRGRCFAGDRDRIPSEPLLTQLAKHLAVPGDAVDWDELGQAIVVEARLGQELQNRLGHATGFRVRSLAVDRALEWIGTVAGVSATMNQAGTRIELDTTEIDDRGLAAIGRMKHITGMLTPVGPPGDERSAFFSRYFHVRRVVTVALGIAAKIGRAGGDVQEYRVRTLAWMHDLNRWPFAHDGEKGLYDQGADLAAYFQDRGIDLDARDLDDLRHIVDRIESGNMTREGLVVLAADRATGVTEDILLAITALGLAPELVPNTVAEQIGLSLHDPSFRRCLWAMRLTFRDRRPGMIYIGDLDRVVTGHAINFISKFCLDWAKFELDAAFSREIRKIKDQFLVPTLFPLVNDQIGHGSFLRERIVWPLIDQIGEDFRRALTTIDDEQAVQIAVNHGLICPDERKQVYPDFDYIERERPESCFRPD